MHSFRAKLMVAGLTSAAAFAFVACSDSYHLDPTPAPTVTVGSGGGGVGGAAGAGGAEPAACVSNSDCPAPTAVCDSVRQACVECLDFADCNFRPGTVCSKGTCVCPQGVDSFCGALPGQSARCVNLVTSSSDCGACNHACFGACNNGKCADPWEPTSLAEAPSPRRQHVAVWTGSRMIVWGGYNGGPLSTGGVYDPAARTWVSTSIANAPSPRSQAEAVWAATKMVVWGGYNAGALGTGGVYDPMTNTWQVMSTKDAPSPRYEHTVVWTGSKVLVWGGVNSAGTTLSTGAQYDPANDTWSNITTNSAPTPRQQHTAVWTSSTMIVYGGFGNDGLTDNVYLAGGGEYDPVGDSWTPLQTIGQPGPRANHTAVWTGSEMLVWGGDIAPGQYTQDGAKYSVQQTAWTPMNGPYPDARFHHTALWIGGKMIIWGGDNGNGFLNNGGIFNPVSNSWDPKGMPTALSGRSFHTAVAVGEKMLVWGGEIGGFTNTGGLFDPAFAP